ncbi:transmembrane protein [Ceratobasidium sp. AG-Ba]|nr:transmembrane protein [Ceratobasidium sp. AG-Ba]
MVPVNALSATSSTFVGHEWGLWRERALTQGFNQASLKDLLVNRYIPPGPPFDFYRAPDRSTSLPRILVCARETFARYLSRFRHRGCHHD